MSGIDVYYRADNAGETSVRETNLTNCSFNKAGALFGYGASGVVNVFWYLDVHVVDSNGRNDASATVNVSDVNGTSLYKGLTNSTGWIPTQTIMEYWQNPSGIFNKTPHWVNASKTGYNADNSQSVISQNTVATRTLTQS